MIITIKPWEDPMTEIAARRAHDFTDRTKYDALMDVVRNRLTTRAFDSSYAMPPEHYEMILEAARHAHPGPTPSPGTLSSSPTRT
jgi:5,6-dimethylbenzimidazole synthase